MKKAFLIIIIILAFALRFYKLGINPPSLYWDEVALGYNAYSIAETLKDEEGKFLPIQYFRSFGDFKPPGYIYAAVPMIKLFGLNEWTTRFPSAFFGSLSVILVYLLTKKLMQRMKQNENISEWIALIAALLLAVSPWHTQLSRVAYEANFSLFLLILAVWLFFKALDNKYRTLYLTLSGVMFVLTMYTFNTYRVFTPLIVLFLGLLYWKEIVGDKYKFAKQTIAPIIIALILFVPLYPHLVSHEGQLRYKEVNIFSDSKPVELSNERIARLGNIWWANIFNNRRVLYAQSWLDGYFQHFAGSFLFVSGDINPRFSLQDVGELYLIELPFLLIGTYMFASQRKKEQLAILGWLFLAPIPAAFAREVPHALRAENMLPTFQIIEAYGFIKLVQFLSTGKNSFDSFVIKYFKPIWTFKFKFWHMSPTAVVAIKLSTLILAAQIIYYLHNYYIHYPKDSESEWQYGYKQMVAELVKLQDNYDRVVVSDAYGRPYINVLFYQKYSPALFQQQRQAKTDETGFGFIDVYAFGKYNFRGVNWKRDIATQGSEEHVLLIGSPNEMTEGKFTKATIKNMKGETVWILNEAPKGQAALLELK